MNSDDSKIIFPLHKFNFTSQVSDDVIVKSKAIIEKSLQRVVTKKFADKPEEGKTFICETMSRIQTSTNPKESVKDADLVLEAIVENLKIKQARVFLQFIITKSSASWRKGWTNSLCVSLSIVAKQNFKLSELQSAEGCETKDSRCKSQCVCLCVRDWV